MRSVNDSPGVFMRVRLPAGPLPRHTRRFCTSRPTLEQPGVSSRIGHRQKRPSAVQLDRCLRAQISPGYARHMHAAVHMHHKDSIMSVSSDPRPGITATEFSETAPQPTARCQLSRKSRITKPMGPVSQHHSRLSTRYFWGTWERWGTSSRRPGDPQKSVSMRLWERCF